MHATSVVGYVFRAAIYCPSHIASALPTGEGEAFDGWALAQGAKPEPAEQELDEIAAAFGIDRMDETTFDSDDFPKAIFVYQIDALTETCETCGGELL